MLKQLVGFQRKGREALSGEVGSGWLRNIHKTEVASIITVF